MPAFQKGAALVPAKLKRSKYSLPELGSDTYITLRSLSAKEVRERMTAEKDGTTEKEVAGYELIARCAVDGSGEPIFTDQKNDKGEVIRTAAQDAEDNLDIAASSVFGIVETILELSGIPTGKDRSKN